MNEIFSNAKDYLVLLMSNEWIRILLYTEPQIHQRRRLFTRRICNAAYSTLDRAYSSQERFPSLVTFSQAVPSWLNFGQHFDTKPQSMCSAAIKDVGDTEGFTLWVNVLDLSEPRLADENKVNGWDCFHIEYLEPQTLILRISYRMSDVIIITGENLDEAADQYLVWLHSCRIFTPLAHRRRDPKQSKERCDSDNMIIKPNIFIIVRDVPDDKSIEDDFLESCLLSSKAQDMDQKDIETLRDYLFARHRYVKWSETVKEDVISSVKMIRRLRRSRKHLWSQSTLCKLQKYFIGSLTRKLPPPLNVVKALSSNTEIEEAASKLWPELFSLVHTAQLKGGVHGHLNHSLIPVIASCFGRNALRHDHSKSLVCLDWKLIVIVSQSFPRCRDLRERLQSSMCIGP